MPNPRSILQTFALKAVLLWMICHSSLCLAENATVTGVVNYRGVIPGSTYVWALEANGTKAAEAILPDGNGTYALSLLKGRGYDFKVFVDGSQNGYPTTGEVWKHYTDWNNSLGGYNLTQIDGNISGIDFSLLDQDSDNDGFLNWHEFKAGTQDNNASSTPPLDFGLIAHWSFDETNGTVLHDSTANEINGTMHGFTNPWNPGREGGAFRFDGVNDYISFPGANQLDDLGPFSFSGWLKLDHNGSGYVIAKRSLGTGYWRYFASGPTKNWLIRKTTGNAPSLSTTSVTPFFQWQHVALTWTGLLNAQNSKMYLDGTLLANVTRASGAGDLISDVGNLFTLGNRPQNNSSYFKGWMDDFRIWNRVITPTEVHSIYNASPESNTTISGTVTHTGTVPGSVIIWVFDESGTKLGSQTLTNGPGNYSFTLPVGHSYDIKAFRDGNGNDQLDPSIGEPYAHWGSWNGSGFDRLPVNGNKTGVDIAITWEADTDSDGFTLWQETQAGTQDNNVSSKPNSAPIDLNSTTVLSIAENQSVGTLMGEFNATDHDLNASLTYKLVSGEGDTDNSLFRINPIGKLRTAAIFDFENNASTYSIRVRVKDEHNGTLEKKFTIALLNGNDGPVIHLGNGGAHAGALWAEIQVFENTLLAHEINATDQDGDVLSFTKTAGADKALFSLNSATGTLSFKAAPDFENPQDVDGNNTYEVWFRVIDGKGEFDEKRLTVRVTDVLDDQNESNQPSLAVISGKVNYTGGLSGSTYVRAYDSNWSQVAEAVLPSGSGNYSLNLTTGQSYDLRAFVDADGNGTLNFYIEPVQVYGDWNTTLQEYMRIPVDGNLTGIDFTLVGLDTDGDGFENFHEYIANTSMVEANSTPGFDFGLVGHWKLKETNGTNAKDSSALRNDGMIKADFNSSSIYVEVPHNKAYLSAEGTVSFWVKIKNFGVDARQGFFAKDAKGFGSGGHLSIYEHNGTLSVRLQSTKASYTLDHNKGMIAGQWTHIAFMWGRLGMSLYQDGELVASNPYSGGMGTSSGGSGNLESIILGAGSWSKNAKTGLELEGFLNGHLRTIRLYNRKINEGELSTLLQIARRATNEPPNGLNLNQSRIMEKQPAGTIVGKLIGADPDANSSLLFFLVSGKGSRNNNQFFIGPKNNLRIKEPLDFEANATRSIRIKVMDEHNASFEKVFLVTVINDFADDISEQTSTPNLPGYLDDSNGTGLNVEIPNDQNEKVFDSEDPLYVPIVRTLFFELDENRTHRFGGRIMTDGGSEIVEAGILISQSIRFSEKIRLTAPLKSGNEQFRIKYKKLEGGTRYYYRAYARNKVGETLGSIRKLMTVDKIDPSAWWVGMPEVGGGWRRSGWLGVFRTYEGIAWIYHAQLGWSYVVSDQNDGIWIWQHGHGWMWSQNGVWPFLYSHRKGNWLYFTKSVGGRPIFYDYGTKDYRINQK